MDLEKNSRTLTNINLLTITKFKSPMDLEDPFDIKKPSTKEQNQTKQRK